MVKLVLNKKSKGEFLARYRLAPKMLKAADKTRGIPSLRRALDDDGSQVLIKTWARDPKAEDSELHEIWRNEIRQLYRLAGLRGASDFIAQLRTSAIDEGGYHLVLSAGQRLPIAYFLAESGALSFANRQNLRGRRLLWGNMLRIAKGLDTLHLQGMLHRNLTSWSILTANDREADFQLTGFEWSMRIVGARDASAASKVRTHISEGQYSFTRDWQQFGELLVTLFDLPKSRISNTSIASHEVSEQLTAMEIRLIRQTLQILPADRLDGQAVTASIEKIMLSLDAAIQGEDLLFQVVLPLGIGGRISALIREAADYQLEVEDEEAQIAFVENDLSSPTLIAIKESNSIDGYTLALRGARLTYYLQDFKKTRDLIPSNWDIAFCSTIGISNRSSANSINSIEIAGNSLLILPLSTVGRSRIKSRTSSWTVLRQKLAPPIEGSDRDKLMRKSLVLVQMLDYVFAASDVFPVDVKVVSNQTETWADEKVRISLSPRKDSAREKLSKALELKDPPATRLANALVGDQVQDDRRVNWVLTDDPNLGQRSNSTEWQYLETRTQSGGLTEFIFVGDQAPVLGEELFLVPGDGAGRDSQLARRLKSLVALADHKELSSMLSDPRSRILNSHDTVIEDDGFLELDKSKQAAFRAVVKTIPLFLVQGPPGVGKTRLVTELVRQTLSMDSSSRLLLSAQSNYAVDHLLQEIRKVIGAGEIDPVVVRCAPPDRKGADTDFDLGNQTRGLLSSLVASCEVSRGCFDLG